jgi:hypothetical protein
MSRSMTLILLFTSGLLHAQSMSQQAQAAMVRPLRIDVQATKSASQADQSVPVQVTLQGGNGQPASPKMPVIAEVQLTAPSGMNSTQTVTFGPGESTKQLKFGLGESGVAKVTVRSVNQQLLGSSTYMYVAQPVSASRPSPQVKSGAKPRAKKKKGDSAPSGGMARVHAGTLPGQVHLALAAYPVPSVQDDLPQAARNTSNHFSLPLMLQVSGVESPDGIPADGKTAAHVQIFWIDSNTPTQEVQIWLTWTNGDLAPNPVVIPPSGRTAEALWTSKYALPSARVRVAATNPPHLRFRGSSEATVKFGDPILSLDFAIPPDNISIVDTLNLTAMFFDQLGNPLRTTGNKSVQFLGGSILRFNPTQAHGHFSFSTIVTPIYVGQSSVQAVSDGYHSPLRPLQVTWIGVLVLCIVGGICGAVLSFLTSQGKLWIRIVSGVIVGAVASWAYVFVGLPNVSAAILHSPLSVLFVSLLAAFSGVKVVEVITTKLNFGF